MTLPVDQVPPPSPDFQRVRKALLLQGEPDRVPNMELWVDNHAMSSFLGSPVHDWYQDTANVVEFWYRAGYDYAHIIPHYRFPKAKLSHQEVAEGKGGDEGQVSGALISAETGMITDWASFERYPWPRIEDVDYGPVERAIALLPPGMKLISGTFAGVFEESWQIMGMETLCTMLADDPELVRAITERVGSFMLQVIERLAPLDGVGAIWHSDDIGFKSGTLISPRALRAYIFPWYRRFGEVCKHFDKPFVYHSDGNLWAVLDDILACGYNGLNPIEPLGMDIEQLHAAYGGKICLIGNIGLEYELTMGTPEDVRARVKQRIARLAPGGGYCCGSSNSITSYVPMENYVAMLQAVREFGRYPIAR
ncbi:MAG: uroporphyrinogen decarboxylase family protein [Anaerolineae bacterium]